MKTIVLNIILVLLSISAAMADPVDSSQNVAVRRSNMRLTTRLHSMGLFNFSGRVASKNPVFDINFNYDRRTWGAMVFSAVDIIDQHSDNNFTLALLYKRLQFGKRLTITPNIGFVVEGFGDAIGDRSIIITSYRLTQKFSVDNTSIFANIIASSDHDWINRFRFMYAVDKHIDLTLSLWHNNHLLDHGDYLSTGLSVFYNRMHISKYLTGAFGISSLMMTETSDSNEFPKKNGLLFTMALVID
jgi:hypothetical protein